MAAFNPLDSPCPAPKTSTTLADLLGADYDDGEDTAAIDFTREIRPTHLAAAGPRRVRKPAAFQIHEDGESSANTSGGRERSNGIQRKTLGGKSTMLAQPAQRFQRPRVNFVEQGPRQSLTDTRTTSKENRAAMQKPKQSNSNGEAGKSVSEKNELKKDVRRRTIYIPPDDTTMPTVFMSLFSPLKSDPTKVCTAQSDETVPINTLEERIAAKKKARASKVTETRRSPLQEKAIPQEPSFTRDVMGKNGGKENIPPGYLLDSEKEKAKQEGLPEAVEMPSKPAKPTSSSKQILSERKSALTEKKNVGNGIGQRSQKTIMLDPKSGRVVEKSSKQTGKSSTTKQSCNFQRRGSKLTTSSSSKPAVDIAPTKLSVPKIPAVTIDQKYPLLTDDISNPILYEDNWLSHQEIIITQLMNCLLDATQAHCNDQDETTLRHTLLDLYQDNSFVLLHKRLHASVLYGALAPPKDVLARGRRLGDDLGLKRAFLDFWANTYNLKALKAAAETIIGRRIPEPAQPSRSSSGTSDFPDRQQKMLRRAIEAFLETFLIRNEDKERVGQDWKSDNGPVDGWAYRRTILRSIMMVVLLDKGRSCAGNAFPSCLFNPSSSYKSSAAALQALGKQLLPSLGDITRALSHLDCHVAYEEHELQQYDFRIRNLAVDLRDGVRLTRLVEILLYPSVCNVQDTETSDTIVMPSGDVLSLREGKTEWPLSQHLKIPCMGRASKLYNVQIALAALSGVQGLGNVVRNVSASDIVDGYREKTIALLWSLVGRWGLASLVDWDDVRNETRRLRRRLSPDTRDASEELENDADSHESLLTQWAWTLARLKGLHMDNMSTSFSDGKIFESIVDEYEGYILMNRNEMASGGQLQSNRRTLEQRLRALGCNSQFGQLHSLPTSPYKPEKGLTMSSISRLAIHIRFANSRS